jgi:hypothetical protein
MYFTLAGSVEGTVKGSTAQPLLLAQRAVSERHGE